MRIAVSAEGSSSESNIDQRFGRCKYFLIFEVEHGKMMKTTAVLNEGALKGHGAGINAAEQMGVLEVDAVLTGQAGPNARMVLEKLGIKTYPAAGKAKEAVERFIDSSRREDEVAEQPVFSKQGGQERIFFPLLDDAGENSRISPHFGHAPFFGIYDTETKKFSIVENDLDHTDPKKSPIEQIQEAVHPTTIYAIGIGERAMKIIAEKGMSLKTGRYLTVGDAIEHLDSLEDQGQSCGHMH